MLWVFLILVGLPMMDLASAAIRATVFNLAAQQAASRASFCQTFLAPPTKGLSAKEMAEQVVHEIMNRCPGADVTQIDVYIVATPLNGGNATTSSTPLRRAADTAKNNYSIRVVVQGTAAPLVTFFGASTYPIPGFNCPMKVSATSESVFESTDGLNT